LEELKSPVCTIFSISPVHKIFKQPGKLSGFALGYWLYDRGLSSHRGCEFFSSPPRPDRLWGLPCLLSNGYQRLFPWK